MNKEDFVEVLKQKAELESKAEAERAYDAILATFVEGLAEGDNITLRSFGSFSIVERASRKGRDPRSGVEMDIPPTKSVKFSPGKELKAVVQAAGSEPAVEKAKQEVTTQAEAERKIEAVEEKIEAKTEEKRIDPETFSREVQQDIDALRTKLDNYMSRADDLSAEGRKVLQEKMDSLNTLADDAKERLKVMSEKAQPALEEIRKGLESAFSDLKNSFKKARDKF
jgi:DNA-binding protein HU-beta